jgi:hypothetical protein
LPDLSKPLTSAYSIFCLVIRAEIDGLTITGGSLVGNGGGISSGATLTISNCAISGNSILTTDGLQHSGAGIYNVGTMTIVNSTVNNNQALIGGFFPPSGGGISSDVGTLTIQNTTISENTAAGYAVAYITLDR